MEEKMRSIQWVVRITSLGLAACASTPAPYERESSTAAAIRAATEVGAAQVPDAALHLKLAQEQLEKGKAQMKDGDNLAAGYTLLRAQVDAELALSLARENKTRSDAEQAIVKLHSLRSEHPAIGGGPSTVP
jgi:hypothetical protein